MTGGRRNDQFLLCPFTIFMKGTFAFDCTVTEKQIHMLMGSEGKCTQTDPGHQMSGPFHVRI